MKLDEDDTAISYFQELCQGCIQDDLINGELPPQVKALEQFVCQEYSATGPRTLPALRLELFRSKNLE